MQAGIHTEDFSDEPWWWRAAPPEDAPPKEGPPGEVTADAVPGETEAAVIGSGYLGLSCALDLARAGMEVTLFEADRLGFGASTRNAGYVSGRAGVGKRISLDSDLGAALASELLDEADQAYEHFHAVVSREAIDCQFKPVGRLVAAHSPAAYTNLESRLADFNSDGQGHFKMIPRQRLREVLGTDLYHGGLFCKNAGTIQPALYHKGLVDACRRAGVRLLSQTRVLGLSNQGAAKLLHTDKGTVKAGLVALGTNGYTDKIAPWHRKRVLPVSSAMIATEALPEEQVRSLFPALCPVIDSKRVVFYARPSPDCRHVLFGGRGGFSSIGARDLAVILHGQMVQMFPELREVKITNVWSGNVAFTRDWIPKIGVHGGLHYGLGCNGSGIALMTWFGHRLARQMLATDEQPSAFTKLPFAPYPLYTGDPWFLPIAGNWYKFLDWTDLRGARSSTN